MRIESVRIQNYRAIKDQMITFGGYTCLVGPNGGGKSTVLNALNVFFQYALEPSGALTRLSKEDFHLKDTSNPISITVTFADLSADAQGDFAGYFRQGKLIITAKAQWDANAESAPVLQYGERLCIGAFSPFFKAEGDGALVKELKDLYVQIREKYPTLPAPGTKQAMIDALHDYETAHATECGPLQSADQFYGISKGKNLLEKYVQWIFVPAVKDASTEQIEARRTALGLILERTVRAKVSFSEPLKKIREQAMTDYQKMLGEYESELTELSSSLTERFQEWAHPDASIRLKWREDAQTAVKLADPLAEVLTVEGVFEGELSRFGHGLQRSFLLTLLQELASGDSKGAPTLLLACEEPELYQHPPQVRHLASVFRTLADDGLQIFVCTHSPLFVRGEGFEDVRMVRRDSTTAAVVRSITFAEIADVVGKARGEKPKAPEGTALKIAQALQPGLNEMFFTSVLVLTEGIEDVSYLTTYMVLTDRWEEFRRLGCHFVYGEGKNKMALPLTIAYKLDIPVFVVFDGDSDKCANGDARKQNEAENRALLTLSGFENEAAIPAATLFKNCLTMWFKDIGGAVRDEMGHAEYEALADRVRRAEGLLDTGNLQKNAAFISRVLATAWDEGKRLKSLDQVCEAIITFAKAQRKPLAAAKPAGA